MVDILEPNEVRDIDKIRNDKKCENKFMCYLRTLIHNYRDIILIGYTKIGKIRIYSSN
jgi:hypothetical protein